MRALRRRIDFAAAILCAAVVGCHNAPPAVPAGASTDRIAFSQTLPRMDGDRLSATLVEVVYGPGGSSPPHRHPCPVIGYVVEGRFRTQVEGGPETIYRAGESFFEEANAVHVISANGSDKEPVRFLAYFTCDQQAPLSIDVPETESVPGRQP